MKTMAFTAGTRWWYPNASRRFAARWNRMSAYIDDGFKCVDLSERIDWKALKHPMFCKGFLWDYAPPDVERIVWFDSDTFACRPVGTGELPTEPFSAVREKDAVTEQVRESKWPGHREIIEFFNAGVFVATRAAMPVFDDLKAHSNKGGEVAQHIDQEWMNLFVARHMADFQSNPTGWNELPGRWNWFKFKNRVNRPIIVHFAGVWQRAVVLDLLYGVADELERTILDASSAVEGFVPLLEAARKRPAGGTSPQVQ